MPNVREISSGAREHEDDDPDSGVGPGPRTFLVVGLGNPGLRYENTPHNVGFCVVDRLAERMGIRVRNNEGMALTAKGTFGGHEVILAKPQTFMNRSGMGVKALLQARKLTAKDVVLIYDDIDLPWMGLRIRKKGSAGGHNGVKSVIAELNTDWFTRVRVGIHPGHEVANTALYDLAPFERSLLETMDEMLTYAAEAVESVMTDGAIRAMTKFNRRAKGVVEEDL